MRGMRTVLWLALFAVAFVIFWAVGNIALDPSWVAALDNAGIVLGYLLACGAVSAAAYSYFHPSLLRSFLRRIFRRTFFEGTGQPFEVPSDKFVAAVIPVSPRAKAEQPRYILNHLRPQRVALLYTEASRPVAAALASDPAYGGIKFDPDATGIRKSEWMIHDHLRPIDAKTIASHFVDVFVADGIAPENIFVDITAGTVPISVGAFQAAEEKGVSTIYVVGTQNGLVKDPLRQDHGKPVFISRHIS